MPNMLCSLWAGPTWALSEAWLKAHPPVQRAPALVPSAAADRDLPTDTSVTPALPEEVNPAPAGTTIDLHASGDSDWEMVEEPSRAWRPEGAEGGSLSVSIPQYNGPAHISGLPQITAAREPPSPSPQPQTTISRTPAVGWLTPLGIGGVSGISTKSLTSAVGGLETPLRIGGVAGKPSDSRSVSYTSHTSAVGRLTPLSIGGVSGISTKSLTSAVGGLAPLRIGGVAGRAGDPLVPDRAPLGGVPPPTQPPRAPVPGVSQAGPLLQHCPPPPNYSTGLLSHSASTARLEEHQIMTQPATGTRKRTKRAAAGPSPASPRGGRRRIQGGKKASRPKKVKAAKPHKEGRSGAVKDSDLLAMMQLVAGRHGWSIGEPPTPASQGLAQAALDPATSAPPPVPPAGQAALYMAPPPASQTGQAASYHTTMAPPPATPAGQAALYMAPPSAPQTGQAASYHTSMAPPPASRRVRQPYTWPRRPLRRRDRQPHTTRLWPRRRSSRRVRQPYTWPRRLLRRRDRQPHTTRLWPRRRLRRRVRQPYTWPRRLLRRRDRQPHTTRLWPRRRRSRRVRQPYTR